MFDKQNRKNAIKESGVKIQGFLLVRQTDFMGAIISISSRTWILITFFLIKTLHLPSLFQCTPENCSLIFYTCLETFLKHLNAMSLKMWIKNRSFLMQEKKHSTSFSNIRHRFDSEKEWLGKCVQSNLNLCMKKFKFISLVSRLRTKHGGTSWKFMNIRRNLFFIFKLPRNL